MENHEHNHVHAEYTYLVAKRFVTPLVDKVGEISVELATFIASAETQATKVGWNVEEWKYLPEKGEDDGYCQVTGEYAKDLSTVALVVWKPYEKRPCC